MAQPMPVPEESVVMINQIPAIPPDWGMTVSDIIWRPQLIAEEEIDVAAVLFNDFNPIHMSAEAAKKAFGDEAPGRIAHGMMVMGQAGGIAAAHYQLGLHEVEQIKFSACFCPGDQLGVLTRIVYDKVRMGHRMVVIEAYLMRKRGDTITRVPKKVPMKIHLQSHTH